jgi:outer membrane protein assembly factor BamB
MARLATAAVYIFCAYAASADDWPVAFHDSLHSGRSSEVLATPLTLAWTWKDTAAYDNDPKWHAQPYPWLPIYYKGRLYIQGGLNANRVFAIDPATGSTLWEADNPGYTASGTYLFQFANYPAAVAGRILSASTDFTVSVDAATGGDRNVVYNTNGGWPSGGATLWNGYGIYQFVETDNGAEDIKFVYDPVAPGQAGGYLLPNAGAGLYTDAAFRVPAVDNNVVYANRLGQLVAWDPPSAQALWTWGSRNFGASPAVWNHIVIFYASTNGVLAAFADPSTATASGALAGLPVLWTAAIPGAYSPIASEGVVYAGSSDRSFYAVDAQSGAVRWKFSTGAPFTALQIPAISGSLIYVPGADGVLYALNKDTGKEVWRYSAGAALGPVAIAGGRLFVSDAAFTLYSFTPAGASVIPSISAISPARTTNATASPIALTGSGFKGVTGIQLDDPAHTSLSGLKVADDGAMSGTVPAGLAPGRYQIKATTPAGTSVDGPSLDVLPSGSYFRNFLGISQGRFDFGTDHAVQRHLVRLPDGTLAATYSGRTADNDVRFTFQLSHDGGKTWAVPAQFPISNGDFSVVWAASFGVSAGQGSQLHMIYSQWPSYRQTFATYSYSGGDLLSLAPKMPVLFSDQPVYPGPSVIDSTGRIWVVYGLGKDIYSSYSTDSGLTWTQTSKINNAPAAPPALTLLNGAPFIVYAENNALVYSAWSGTQWTAPQMLPGPIAGAEDNISLAATPDGRAHVAAATSTGVRYLAFDGTLWSAATVLDGSGSMPSITTDGTDVWCFYVSGGKNIVFRRWRRDTGAWDAAVSVTNDSLTSTRPATLPLSPDGSIPVIWTVGTASPYEIHSAVIPVQTAGAAALDIQAFATPRLVTARQSTLAVSAIGGQPPYTYSWSAPDGCTLADAASASTSATCTRAGTYRMSVTVRDSTGASSIANRDVAVASIPTTIKVNPPSNPLVVNSSYSFTATVFDQFGDPMPLTPPQTWALAPGSVRGFLDPSGTFLAQQAGDFTVTATLPGGASATLTVTVQAASALPPVISAITCGMVTATSVTIQWLTNIPADSLVEYGMDTSYGTSATDGTMTTTHQVVLTDLVPGRIYHFRVQSASGSGKAAVSGDLTFTTARGH